MPRVPAAHRTVRALGGTLGVWLCLSTAVLAQATPPELEDHANLEAERSDGHAAEQLAPEPPGYAEAIDAAIREHELGHFVEARELLLRAQQLYPSARTLRGLGKVEYELRNYGHSVSYLQRALDSKEKPLDARLRADVEQVLVRARAYVGEVHVDVQPGEASVIVDGITVASGPQASFSLLVGDHVIEFRADGRLPERRAVRIKGGEETKIQVVLSPPVNLSPRLLTNQASAPQKDAVEDKPLRKRWWVWAATAAVLGGTAAVLAVTLRDDDSEPALNGGSAGVVLRNP